MFRKHAQRPIYSRNKHSKSTETNNNGNERLHGKQVERPTSETKLT